jgi:2-C-methyl-D-erythritol 4-phosphate cytidylyltransferase / 2-C-methyl-D-erythritol 2,4-cyclodiphosphate synthase
MSKTVALVVAAGKGLRTGSALPKQYAMLAGKPVVAHSVDAFLAHPGIDRVLVVIGDGQETLAATALGSRNVEIVLGGAERIDSVRAGLAAAGRANRFLIHDAARPGLSAAVIDSLLAALHTHEGAVPALPVPDTLACNDGLLGDTVDRGTLVRVQTPQAFRVDALASAHAAWTGGAATDDAQILRAAGYAVAIVDGLKTWTGWSD